MLNDGQLIADTAEDGDASSLEEDVDDSGNDPESRNDGTTLPGPLDIEPPPLSAYGSERTATSAGTLQQQLLSDFGSVPINTITPDCPRETNAARTRREPQSTSSLPSTPLPLPLPPRTSLRSGRKGGEPHRRHLEASRVGSFPQIVLLPAVPFDPERRRTAAVGLPPGDGASQDSAAKRPSTPGEHEIATRAKVGDTPTEVLLAVNTMSPWLPTSLQPPRGMGSGNRESSTRKMEECSRRRTSGKFFEEDMSVDKVAVLQPTLSRLRGDQSFHPNTKGVRLRNFDEAESAQGRTVIPASESIVGKSEIVDLEPNVSNPGENHRTAWSFEGRLSSTSVGQNGGSIDTGGDVVNFSEQFPRFAAILSAYHNGRTLTREADCRSLPLTSSNVVFGGRARGGRIGRPGGGLTACEEEACLYWQWKLYAIYIRVIKVIFRNGMHVPGLGTSIEMWVFPCGIIAGSYTLLHFTFRKSPHCKD